MIQHPAIQEALLGQLFLKQIFKVVYTAVFCLEKEHFKQESQMDATVDQSIQRLVESVLEWGPGQQEETRMLNSADVSDNFQEFIIDLISNLPSV